MSRVSALTRWSESIRQSGHRRYWLIVAALLPVFAAVYLLSFWLRFDGELAAHATLFRVTAPVMVLLQVTLFGGFRVYRGWSRHVTIHDLLIIAQATTASTIAFWLTDIAIAGWHVPRSVLVLDWGATLVVVGGLRGSFRLTQEMLRMLPSTAQEVRVLIVGADQSADLLLRALRQSGAMHFRVVGLIADDLKRQPASIAGVPVLGSIDDTCELARQHDVSEVLIANGDLNGRVVKAIVTQCREANISVRTLPSFEELISGKVAVQPRPISIVDLLRRDPVQLETNNLRDWIDGQVVMVTGSAGSIGSEICRQLLAFSPKKLVLVDRSENGQFYLERSLAAAAGNTELEVTLADLNDEPRMRRLFMRHRPAIVFHAAAYKHVPLMEAHPGEAIKNTVLATYQLANLVADYGVQSFVMISTDKAVNPTNVMGAAKRVAELYVQALAEAARCRFVTVRFGNVLDSAGSVVPLFRDQIARGGPVTVTDPRMRRYFMTIPEAAQLVLQAGVMGRGGEIFVLDMGEPVHIVDLAEEMIRLSGLRVGEDIEIEFVGLRPGEKLFEELHVDGETHVATRHPKIMVAQCLPQQLSAIRESISRLREISEAPSDEIVSELQAIVPEYRSTTFAQAPPQQRRMAA